MNQETPKNWLKLKFTIVKNTEIEQKTCDSDIEALGLRAPSTADKMSSSSNSLPVVLRDLVRSEKSVDIVIGIVSKTGEMGLN
jgi:riboflavin synthase